MVEDKFLHISAYTESNRGFTEGQSLRLPKSVAVIITLSLLVFFFGCSPEVGSKKWCSDMKEKPKRDWTANEAADYTKHCIFKVKRE